jgi:8-oxoguanine deaminase
MESVRQTFLLGRLAYDPSSITHLDAFQWATEGSAEFLGRSDIGKIGRQEDIAVLDVG